MSWRTGTRSWPLAGQKKVGIEARAILAVSNYLGAHDFADSKPASFESIQKREYHHIFPDALLVRGWNRQLSTH